ncbi:hypothetical protein [Sphingobacterium sp.]|uniref:hypothetical protein n=1 Tax=Sphingobacterium sp. TaxID=341027 RepID=UPI0031E07879
MSKRVIAIHSGPLRTCYGPFSGHGGGLSEVRAVSLRGESVSNSDSPRTQHGLMTQA